jgi:hypothetical protein
VIWLRAQITALFKILLNFMVLNFIMPKFDIFEIKDLWYIGSGLTLWMEVIEVQI